MPYVVVKDAPRCPVGRPWAVKRQGTDRTFGCHPTKAAGLKQAAALYANIPESKSAGSESKTGHPEVPMTTTTASPVLTPKTIEWRRERARALSENQRKRTETRQAHAPLELRAGETDGTRVLRSYACLFDEPYIVRAAGYRFEEVVRSSAFKRTLGTSPDVVFRTEHSGPPLAATWSSDLRLGADSRGLWYEVDMDESDPDVVSLISKVERGVYRESSFAFRVPQGGDAWNEAHDQREVLACELDRGDVSVVTFGASRGTGEHMSLRSDESVQAIQAMGFDQFVQVFKEWRDFTLLPREERIGKVISSQSMESLRQVLGLIADADDAVDEAEAMLADFLGVPNPDEDAVTTSEQLTHTGRGETRDCESYEDWDIAYGLKNVKLAIASVKAAQLCDPGNGTDPDDAAVMDALNQLDADVDVAIVAQAADRRPDSDEMNAEVTDLLRRCEELGTRSGCYIMWVTNQDGSRGFQVSQTATAPEATKPEERSQKPATRPVVLARNDTEDLRDALMLRRAS